MSKPKISITRTERTLVKDLLDHYVKNRDFIKVVLNQLSTAILGSPELMEHIHSTQVAA